MLRVIRKSISLANAPSLTETEYGLRAGDWCELLCEIIPEPRLMDAFMRAARDHASAFPVNAYEVKNAWANIEAEEQAAKKNNLPADDLSAIANCSNRHNHADNELASPNEGLVVLYDPGDDSERMIPCWSCRPKAYAQRQAEYIESKQGAGPPKAVTSCVDAFIKSREPVKTVADDGTEFLKWCIKELIGDYTAASFSESGHGKVLRYPLFGKKWRVVIDAEELQRIGLSLHSAIEYIRVQDLADKVSC